MPGLVPGIHVFPGRCNEDVDGRVQTGHDELNIGYRPTCPRWRRKWSASTQAIMASPTGTARMPTQGSCRPLVKISVSPPLRSTVRRGVRIDDVGFTAKRTTTGCPVEMPPRMPPAWLDRKVTP